MIKSHKISTAVLIIAIFALFSLTLAVEREMCDKCKANPEKCKLATGGECESSECQVTAKTEENKNIVEKKIVVKQQDMNRGFLGIVTKEEDGKLKVLEVVPESPAEKAGIKEDDIVLEINGAPVKTRDELIKILSKTKPGDTANFKIKSDNKVKIMKIELAKVPMPKPMMEKEMCCPECGAMSSVPPRCPMMDKPMRMGKEMPMMPMEGMMMPAQEMRGFIGVVTEEENGRLVIQSITPNSPAEKAGLKEDDIISEINGIRVTTPSELVEILKTTRPGDIAHLKIISGGIEKMVDIELGTTPASKTTKIKFKVGKRHSGEGGGAGYFGPGATFFDYRDLNSLYANNFLDTIEKPQFVFGGGGWGQIGRVRLGGYGCGGMQTISNDTINIENAFGVGFFEFGYSVLYEKHLIITPVLAVGGGGISLKIKSYDHPYTLDSLLLYPYGVAKVSKGGLMMYPGLAIDIPISFVGLHLKGGYIWSPLTSSWMMEEFGNISGPDLKLMGPFASLNVMFGGFSKHRK